MQKRTKLAYLASEYPGLSHTFIFREIHSLRNLGYEVKTSSIRRPKNIEKMTEDEKRDAEDTLYIKDSSLFRIIKSHMGLLLRSPIRYFKMFNDALSHYRSGSISLFKAIAYFAEAGILLDWMHKYKINHIHVHFGNPAATVAMIATIYETMTYSMSIHGPDVFYNIVPNVLVEKVKRALSVRSISLYCQSQLQRLVPHELWSKFHIVRCGINPDIFQPRPTPSNEIPEILCLGRLVPAKGQHILLEAISILKDRGVQCHLTFVGDGEDRKSLEQLTKDQGLEETVTFTGAVGQGEVHKYYNKADIFVLSSFAEGVPVVLMEAMAKEIVSVSTCITGIPELIESGTDGILVPPADTISLADNLQNLLSDKTLRLEMGKKGREKVLEMYDLNKNCEVMANFFDKSLSTVKS